MEWCNVVWQCPCGQAPARDYGKEFVQTSRHLTPHLDMIHYLFEVVFHTKSSL